MVEQMRPLPPLLC
jgi:hypothetical protein